MKKLSLNFMSFLYFSAGFNHFLNPDFYHRIMPAALPFPGFLIALSGAIEMLLGILLLRKSTRSLAAWGIILMLIAFLPVHFSMYSTGGAAYGVPNWTLLVRIPLQFVLIGWAYLHTKNPEIDTRSIKSQIQINASADRVWQTLTEFSLYPEWNPLIVAASGKASLGEKLRIWVRPPIASGAAGPNIIPFENVIVECDPKRSLAWKGRFLWRGLFEGHHFMQVTALSENQTELINGETYTGALIPLMSSALDQTAMGFTQMNEALKKRCESAHGTIHQNQDSLPSSS